MLKSRIEIDLPGIEVQRSLGPVEWLQSLFGVEFDRRSGEIETTVGAFSLVQALYRGFSSAGVTDAVSFLVDRKAIYVDTKEVTHDLDLVWQAARLRKVTERPFKEMHLVLTRHQAGLHLLFDARVNLRAMESDPHLTIEVSGRPEELRIRRGESAQEYALRVRELTRNDGGAEAYRGALQQIAEDVAHHLVRELPGARVEVVDAHVQIVRPGQRELARFRGLRFGRDVVEPSYRPVPTQARAGAYADPFVYYYYDPYWDFTSYLLIDSMLHHHHWHTPDVVVVDPSGAPLFDGAHVDAGEAGLLDAVSVGDDVSVSSAVPDQSGWGGDFVASGTGDPGTDGSTSGGGWWGGSDTSSSDGSSDGGWGGSDVGSSDGGGGSSCGSSCGGSSCGGGCGGGGD